MDDKKLIIKKIEGWTTIFFFCLAIFVLILLTQTLLLAWLNQFKFTYILISLGISSLFTAIFFRFIKKDIKLIPHLNIAVLLVILLISLILIFFPHDSLGGRDEGMYSGLAIILSKYHNFSVPQYLFKVPLSYGTTNQTLTLTTPAYVVWLATQKVLFGTEWMLRSNVVLIFLGLCSLFLVSSLITKKSLAFIAIILFSTSMPFLWFSRETMTENMAFFLLWFLILSLFLFIKTKKNYFLVSIFFSSLLFSFSRREGLFLQIPVLVILATVLLIRKIFPKKKVFYILITYISLIVLSFFVNNDFSPIFGKASLVSDTLTSFENYVPKTNIIRLGDGLPFFVFQMLSKINLSLAIYSIPLVMVLIIVGKKKVIKDKILYISLLGIISVEFLKLINPRVSPEQPWMYRRYLYAILPFGYLSLSILLNKFIKQKPLVFIVYALLIANITISSRIITLKNNWQITEKIEKLTQNVSTNDFVIIDGYILGNYYPASFLAYHKEVRNLYNWWIDIGDWQPKEKEYQGLSYSKLFYLSDNENATYKGFKLRKIGEVEVESNQLQSNCELRSFGRELGLNIDDLARLPYFDVIKYCSKVDNEIINLKKKIVLYELFYE